MRIRSIKPEFWSDDETTGLWPVDEKLVYIGLWTLADDCGNVEWRPRVIASTLFPYPEGAVLTSGGDEIDVPTVLDRLVSSHRVLLYEANGKQYAHIVKFREHQSTKNPSCKYPHSQGVLPLPQPSPSPPPVVTKGEGEGKGKGEKRTASKKRSRPRKLSDEELHRRQGLIAMIHRVFREVRHVEYVFLGPDWPAVDRLRLTNMPIEEIEKRWRHGLKGKGWKSCGTVAQLASKLNDLIPPVDAHEDTFRRLDAEAERELAQPRSKHGGRSRAAPADMPPRREVSEAAKAMQATVGKFLGDRRSTGGVQDGAPVESGSERSGESSEGLGGDAGDDSGRDGSEGAC